MDNNIILCSFSLSKFIFLLFINFKKIHFIFFVILNL